MWKLCNKNTSKPIKVAKSLNMKNKIGNASHVISNKCFFFLHIFGSVRRITFPSNEMLFNVYCTVLCSIRWMEAAAHIGISTNDIIMKLIFKPNGQSTTKMLHFTMWSIWMVTKSEPPEKYHFSSIMEVRKLHKSRKLQQIFFHNVVCFFSCTQSFLFMLKLIHCRNAMDYHFLGKLPKASQSVLQVTANFGIILLFSLFVFRWMHLTSLPFSETHYVTKRNRMNWGWKLSFCSGWSKQFESKSRSFM